MKLFHKSAVRRLFLLALVPAALLLTYSLWSPGRDIRDGRHDRRSNALWLQHAWLGDDTWFAENPRATQKENVRDSQRLARFAAELQRHHVRYVFPHLCPAQATGSIARSDSAQVERFLDAMQAAKIETLPWIGGVRGGSALPGNANWRRSFSESCVQLLNEHPRLSGIHVNIEPMPSGDPDFLLLLDELRAALPRGKILSIAAYPPPTNWQRAPSVHWDEAYSRAVAARADQVAVMMYDTSLRTAKLYEKLMRDWTVEVLEWYSPKQVLLGIPAYDDAGVDYHDPATENLAHAIAGIHAGLGDIPPEHFAGVSIYCEWQMTEDKWQTFSERFAAPLPSAF
jgi:hypothetical protein